MAKQQHIVFTGGGTLGHVMPNLPLIEHYQQEGWKVSYIGSKAGEERAKIEGLGIPYYPIRTGKLRRYFDFQNFLDIFNVAIAIVQSFFLLLRLRPTVLFSKGGYVALPPVIGAWLMRVPTIIHESDMTPGLTTKISKRFAKQICVSFQNATRFFPKDKVHWTGLPVRNLVFQANKARGLEVSGFTGKRPILLTFGGSLGAAFLNTMIRENVKNGNLAAYDVINICGSGKLDPTMQFDNYVQFESLADDFLHIMKASDLVITRGGATSLFELLAMKKLHIIIPLSKNASRGDQIHNANYFSSLEVSTFLEEEDYIWEQMHQQIQSTLENKALTLAKIDSLEFANATKKVIAVIDKVATK
ncbi:undecaprenyldiphospho-muramoylpentapeptide beta-N-acetylglucosaminyltransferase [Aureispira anguillae]|uniref:UDP-N-acetylglucosamine--N-acetylmuramyl-(pentapeptide) pyrophosphoryl-undecaprenol N-acetylglucosamine transferase n=1 Tax=Aureispira anguillae TaxID=2864201 RepID=A0A915YLW0_9BACT|nr:undecaprenyldiphospho-muramoylpentapeptide beta-N-acetylglucosaminyltransferase [Aureispira anguillae]BDS15614.1 undecaprenyldiphospho-muramoylpentapeptide beta-N-acetylglucosaminyltransferase [Aureispira anguillae]